MRVLAFGVALSTLIGGVVMAGGPFPASNVTLRTFMDLSSFPSNPSTGNDCWGYTSPSGREYALMGLRNALAVVEVTNPDSPVIVGSVSHSSSDWADVKVYQDHCYVTNESGGGLDVIDLSDVDNGNVTLVQRLTGGGLTTAHNVAIDTDSGFLYLCGANLNGGRLRAYDLSTPGSPVLVGSTPASEVYVHDAQVVTYNDGPLSGRQIAFCANPSVGLDIYDVTNKANMFRVSRTTYPLNEIPHQCWLSEDRKYLYFGDEGDETNAGVDTRTVIFDVQDINNPTVVGTFTNGLTAIDHNLYAANGLLYEANYSTGLRVFDLANPVEPVEIAFIDTFPEDDRTEYVGAWSVYPFFDSGTVIVSDYTRGLFVVTLDVASLGIALPSGSPSLVAPGQSSDIDVRIVERFDSVQAGSETLFYRFDGGVFQSTTMTPQGGDMYLASLPGASCGDMVEFYVAATSVGGETVTFPSDAPASLLTAEVGEEAVTFEDDMEIDRGWTSGAAGDDATTGLWTRVNPIGTAAQPEDDNTDAGALCWVTGQGSVGGGLGENDVDGGSTTLLSPVLDLSANPEAMVSYARWYSNASGASPGADTFVIEISNNNGGTWTNLETVGPTGPATLGGWIDVSFRVADFVPVTDQVRLRFIASDLGSGSIVEAAIDDFAVSSVDCVTTQCPGDANGDQTVDFDDLNLILTNWAASGAPGIPGDLDDSGSVDFDDLNLVLSNWGASCP